MTRKEAIEAMRSGKKVTHNYFNEYEYLQVLGNEVYTESGKLEKDFIKERGGHGWEVNWVVYDE